MSDSHVTPPPPSPSAGRRRAGTTAALIRAQDTAIPQADRAGSGEPPTPAQAFDALHAYCAPALIRQAYLLTGRHDRARDAVVRAFRLAWQRWPEVAHDRDPAGWVRAATYDCALSPWHRLRLRDRHPDPPSDPADRALQRALLRLPPSYRRTLVLYDGVGLDLPETAAETEASTPATANRLMHAREAVAACLPELADPAALHRGLLRLGSAERSPAPGSRDIRTAGERSIRAWTRCALALTVTVAGATALTLETAPTHYLAPVSPGHAVQGLPVPGSLGPLSRDALKLSTKLRKEAGGGPERLVPQAR
ncbi:RNA polymerase sigma factor [Streptomyces mexicanus]|uniref:RNA polymerase sigma factor n=1 Tax=Streptomyces mexicanus TaxID=178566 RepID=UPI00366993A0